MNFLEILQEQIDILQENSVARIRRAMDNGDWSILTSWRGDESDEENQKNFTELKAILRGKSVKYIELEGVGQEEEGPAIEPSLFVIGLSEDEAVQIMKKYKQFAVVVGKKGSDKGELVEKSGKRTQLGKFTPGQTGEFFSRVKGKPFIFKR